MAISRRTFCRDVSASVPAALLGTRLSALPTEHVLTARRAVDPIRLDSNENPYGPSPAARAAIVDAMSHGGRYPGPAVQALVESLAKVNGVAPGNVMLTVGSTEALAMCARAYTRADAPLVTAAPTYDSVAAAAERLGNRAIRVPIAAGGSVDLDAMAARSTGAGLVYVCNPNNPTGVSVSGAALREFVGRLATRSPKTTVLVGEAYHEYMETPSYESMAGETLRNPRLLVTRTFSKLYGLAGMRIGYLIGDESTLRELSAFRVGLGANFAAVAAAGAALADDGERVRQRRLNREGRVAAEQFFSQRGWRTYPGEANYLFVEIRRDVAPFRAACEAKGLLIGRPYPPATTWARITIGTPDEMGRALGILEDALRST